MAPFVEEIFLCGTEQIGFYDKIIVDPFECANLFLRVCEDNSVTGDFFK